MTHRSRKCEITQQKNAFLLLQEHFDNLERNRFNTQWKEKFLQYMFQEPPLQISADDLQDQGKYCLCFGVCEIEN